MKRLSVITLDGVLPDVFQDSCPDSGIWLRNVAFERPEKYLIHAESGTGKSSLCSFLYGNRRDYTGHIFFDGEDIRNFSVKRWCGLRQHSLALLPQEMRLFPELTVMDNIDIKNRLTGHKTTQQIMEMLHMLGIDSKAYTKARFLSIGQQQRAAIVRTLCQPFDFLLLDEPVSHLDERNNMIVTELIAQEAEKNNASVITTSVGNDLKIEITRRISL